jgi:ABC-type sugar transport system permease subunit
VLLLMVFNLVPTLFSFVCMGLQWDLLTPPQWAGWATLEATMHNPKLARVLSNTAFLTVTVTLGIVLLSIVVAWGIYTLPNPRWQTYLKASYFAPYVTPSVAMSLVFGLLCQPTGGLSHALHSLGLTHAPVALLQTPHTALPMIALVDVWKFLGYNVLLLLAGFQQLGSALFESASLEGCPAWKQLWWIALPNVTSSLWLVGITASLQAMQTFDTVYLLTQGGPNGATQVLTFWLFQTAFVDFNIGQASVMACFLLVLVGMGYGLKRLIQHRTSS